jgi:hypothetical protein
LEGDLFIGVHSGVIGHGNGGGFKINEVQRIFESFENSRKPLVHPFGVFARVFNLDQLAFVDLADGAISFYQAGFRDIEQPDLAFPD